MKKTRQVVAAILVAVLAGCSSPGSRAGAIGQEQLAAIGAAPGATVAPDMGGAQRVKQGLQSDGSIVFKGNAKEWGSEDSNRLAAMRDVEVKFASYLRGPVFSRVVAGFLKAHPVTGSDGRMLQVSLEEKFMKNVWHSELVKVDLPSLEWTDDWLEDGRVYVEGTIRPEGVSQLRNAMAAEAMKQEIALYKQRQGLSREAEADLDRAVADMLRSDKPVVVTAQ